MKGPSIRSNVNTRLFQTMIIFLLSCSAPETKSTETSSGKQSNSVKEVSIRGTEIKQIESAIVEGMSYDIHITLPTNYYQSRDSLSVVYYLDAYYWGGIVIETYRLLRAYKEIAPLILVGISYDNASTYEAWSYRSRDFLPTVITEANKGSQNDMVPPLSGGASKFLQFLNKELKPMVSKNYRTKEEGSGIFGISNGALFATYVLFTDPGSFDNYLIGSPALYGDNFVTLKFEEEYYTTSKHLPASIFLSVASDDFPYVEISWKKLKDRIESRDYDGLALTTHIFEGENHLSGIPATISRGFRELYRNEHNK